MSPTQTGITVCWVSDAPAIGTVTVAGSAETAKDAAATRYHRVKLDGTEALYALRLFRHLRRRDEIRRVYNGRACRTSPSSSWPMGTIGRSRRSMPRCWSG